MALCRGKGRTLLLLLVLLFSAAILVWFFLFSPPIVIHWQTETEEDTIAFNVVRSEAGTSDLRTVNTRPIVAQGSTLTGAEYSYIDSYVQRGHTYTYQLQEITSQGELVTYPWQTSAQSQRSWQDAVVSCLILSVIWGWWLLGCRKHKESKQALSDASLASP